ncbi:MAG: hypothetical protein LBH13_09300 [Cellulomonadaceae bacterium]|nr:hypothetical protein [Cellulomonadaceae bacterium]
MTTTAIRKRIHITETPRLTEILERHRAPGEPKAATLVRMVERVDFAWSQEPDFIVFDPQGPQLTNEDIARLLQDEDAPVLAQVRS